MGNHRQPPPILIVCAGRSGSKLLRRILNHASGTVVFPREINYVWRHGNAALPTDELGREHARPEVRSFIRQRFDRLSRRAGNLRVIEKTCANSLRVPFVHAVFPEAHIVHVVRDGRAVAESARRKWMAPLDIKYLWDKARWVPVVDIPYYGWRFARFQMARLRGESRSPSSWGPRFTGMDRAIHEHSLIEVCAMQWRACVQAATHGLQHLPASQVAVLKYEDLVCNPIDVVRELYERLDLEFSPKTERFLRGHITQQNLNKWQRLLSDAELELITPHLDEELVRQRYTN